MRSPIDLFVVIPCSYNSAIVGIAASEEKSKKLSLNVKFFWETRRFSGLTNYFKDTSSAIVLRAIATLQYPYVLDLFRSLPTNPNNLVVTQDITNVVNPFFVYFFDYITNKCH